MSKSALECFGRNKIFRRMIIITSLAVKESDHFSGRREDI
jgi:hypothetical protein